MQFKHSLIDQDRTRLLEMYAFASVHGDIVLIFVQTYRSNS